MSTDEDKPNKQETDQPKLLTGDAEPLDTNEEAANALGIDPEVLGQLPPEARRIVKEMFLSVSGPMRHPVLSKITADHISTLLEQSGKDDERLFQDRGSARKYGVFYALLAVALFVFLTVYLIGIDLALYQDVLKIIVAFAGGLGGGFGIKVYLDKH